MRNYLKNTIKDRLTYCKDWKNSVELYLANKEISNKSLCSRMYGLFDLFLFGYLVHPFIIN